MAKELESGFSAVLVLFSMFTDEFCLKDEVYCGRNMRKS